MKFERPGIPGKEIQEEYSIPEIPKSEIIEGFCRSSGPGGQRTNKKSTKVVIKFHIHSSSVFTPEQKNNRKKIT